MLFDSERTYVRSFKEEDLDDFMIYRNDMDWMAHQGFKCLTKDQYREALIKEADYTKGSQFAIIRKEDHVLIGDLYLLIENHHAWIGYTIAPEYARKGYAYEIVEKMIEWLLQNGRLEIYAGVSEKNKASIKLLEKLGFKYDHTDQDDVTYKYNQS